VIVTPLVLLFFRSPQPDKEGGERLRAERRSLWAYRGALLSRPFLTLIIAACMFVSVMLGLQLSLIPILRGHGLGAESAAAIAGVSGLFSIVGRLLGGTLIDRYSGRVIGAISFAIPLIACALLLYGGPSVGLAILASAVVGFALGAELDIVSYLISRYYDREQFGGLYGSMLGLMGVAASTGPMLASWFADRTGGYAGFIWAIMPVFAIGALLITTLPKLPVLNRTA